MSTYADVFGQGGLNSEVDESQLIERIGLDDEEIQWRKDFLNFGDDDAARLASLAATFEQHEDAVANAFYDNLTEHDETVEVIERSPKDVEALKQTQRAYWRTLTDGEYGREYFTNRARIGKLHELLDMPEKHYIGQYGVYYELLFDVMNQRMQSQVTDVLESAGVDEETILDVHEQIDDGVDETLSALKLMNLDMQVAIDTYTASREAELEDEIERRRQIAEETNEAAQDLQEFANNVSQSSRRISDLTDTEAGNIDEIRAEMSNLSATIEEIAATADEVEKTSERAVDAAKEGQSSGATAIDVMEDIEASAEQIGTSVAGLQDRTEEIDEIVDVINDIAEQTNLLALNASIEAARAGEAGDGFAVVADEVKSLAEESQDQADQIETTIRDIQGEIDRTVENVEATAADIDTGIDRVEDAMEQLDEIVRVVEEAANGIKEVSKATDDQAGSGDQIARMLDEAADRINEINEEIDEVATANEQQTAKVFKVTSDLKQLSQKL
ncbi:globin-coupled sensor protein [Halobellus ordinarius]|uniref:globin-coupled sensor protein n=1 Tax=Halobellus ordinarius TaxID=3075120 RepID=UPI0028807888|nr:globin-coupled sensor protein [Halobellus sp. ZY16]